MKTRTCALAVVVLLAAAAVANAQPVFISTGPPDGRLGSATNPAGAGLIERETADDFVLAQTTRLTSATIFGLLPRGFGAADITDVVAEIYGVFPVASNVGRTSGPPTFSTPQVPTRVNSPSDVALDTRALGSGLTLSATMLGTFTVSNSVVNGIDPLPNVRTGGEGPVTGEEVMLTLDFTNPFVLSAGHYFLVPQVGLTSGQFLWLSAARPIAGAGTTPFSPDLQSWIRDENLAPDWLRIGTDIVGPPPTGGPAATFNAAFTLTGTAVPEPSSLALAATGLAALGALARRRRRQPAAR